MGGRGIWSVDDVSCTSFSTTKPEKVEKEDDGELPSVAEFMDKWPEEAEQGNIFPSSAK